MNERRRRDGGRSKDGFKNMTRPEFAAYLRGRPAYSTGEMARFCDVAPRTVAKWFDSGELKGYRIPGSQDRRAPKSEFLRFLKAHRMPWIDLIGRRPVPFLSADPNLASRVQGMLGEGYDVTNARSPFELGVALGAACVTEALVIDRVYGSESVGFAASACDRVGTALIVLCTDDTRPEDFPQAFAALPYPVDPVLLATQIRKAADDLPVPAEEEVA